DYAGSEPSPPPRRRSRRASPRRSTRRRSATTTRVDRAAGPACETAVMAKRNRRERRREVAATADYTDPDGNVLTLRRALSPGTISRIAGSSVKAGGSAEDAWQRRTELLFERLAVSWEVAGLP